MNPLPPEVPATPRLSLTEHLEELRRRLGICLVSVVVTSCVGFRFAGVVIEWLKRPAGSALPKLAFFAPTEPLFVYCQVAVAVGIVLALPIVLYQLWGFVRQGLTWRERFYGLAFVSW